MTTKVETQSAILSPTISAARIGISVPELVALIRVYRYDWSERKVGGKPGDRGRNRWGMTEAQIASVIRGQARRFDPPKVETEPVRPIASAVSPDGKERAKVRLGRLAKR